MKIRCEKCSTVYSILDPEAIKKISRVRCKRCHHIIKVSPPLPSKVHRPTCTKAGIQPQYKLRSDKNEDLQKEDPLRLELLQHVFQKREKIRADRKTDHIAEGFFETDDKPLEQDDHEPAEADIPTPDIVFDPPEEYFTEQSTDPGKDPFSDLFNPNDVNQTDESKLDAVMAAQAGVATTGRKIGVGVLVVSSLIAIIAFGYYLVFQKAESEKKRIIGPSIQFAFDSQLNANLDKDDNKQKRPVVNGKGKSSKSDRGKSLITERASKKKRQSPQEKKINNFYQSDERQEIAPRVTNPDLLVASRREIDMNAANSDAIDALAGTINKRTKQTRVEPLKMPRYLSHRQVYIVIQKHKNKVKSCHQRQLKRDPTIAGKMYVVAKVRPNGQVQHAHIATAKFNGTFVEKCLIEEIKRWRFPSFKGEAYDLKFPLLLTAKGG